MGTSYPSLNEFQQAILDPKVRFQDPLLKQCQAEKDLNGLPRPLSGNFALTFKFYHNGHSYAVRCFTREITEREMRYKQICSFLSTQKHKYFIPIEYHSQGILINGNWYPITVMEWIQGDTLEKFVIQNLNNHSKINSLINAFQEMIKELDRLKVAHGDLSHRNILVQDDKIILIDYDGMFVPALKGQKSTELGSINFQHPQRTPEVFNENLDRFSEIVIFLALKSISYNPNLFNQFETGGEGLLFKKGDFLNPNQSSLLQEIEKIPELRSLVARFRQICLSDIKNVPSLEEFLNQKSIDLPQSKVAHQYNPTPYTPYPVCKAEDKKRLLELQGQMVSVIGKITGYKDGITRNGNPYIFLNFGDWRNNCFTVVMWSETLEILEQMRRKPGFYYDKWVCVNGLVSVYKGRPQIIITSPTDIEVLKSEQEAQILTEPQKNLKEDESFSQTEARSSTVIEEHSRSNPQVFSKTCLQSGKDIQIPKNNPENSEKDREERLNQLYKDMKISNISQPSPAENSSIQNSTSQTSTTSTGTNISLQNSSPNQSLLNNPVPPPDLWGKIIKAIRKFFE